MQTLTVRAHAITSNHVRTYVHIKPQENTREKVRREMCCNIILKLASSAQNPCISLLTHAQTHSTHSVLSPYLSRDTLAMHSKQTPDRIQLAKTHTHLINKQRLFSVKG